MKTKSKFNFPVKLYARTEDNKTIDISYAPQNLNAVEYVLSDAFIEKAGEFMKIFFNLNDTEIINCCLEKFEDYMNNMILRYEHSNKKETETDKMISDKEFDKDYFDKCWRLANCGCYIFEYFKNNGVDFKGKYPLIDEFCEYFWDKAENFTKWNKECSPSHLEWTYTDETGHMYDENEMLELIKKFLCK